MDTLDSHTWLYIGVVVLLAAVAAWLFYQQHRSQHLQERFGPEYHRTLSTVGDRAKAESELTARENRVKKFRLVALAPADAARFTEQWHTIQGRFVDDPRGAVVGAERLVRDLMQARGYPMADFEDRAADISVDHPAVVDNYRAAQGIAVRAERNEASTEDLRKAVVHFRALFAELLEVRNTERQHSSSRNEVRT